MCQELNHSDMWILELHSHYANILYHVICVSFFLDWHFETPQQVQFVEKLSDVVIGQLPNFWKLWISYVNGSLFSEVNTHQVDRNPAYSMFL